MSHQLLHLLAHTVYHIGIHLQNRGHHKPAAADGCKKCNGKTAEMYSTNCCHGRVCESCRAGYETASVCPFCGGNVVRK